LTAHIVADDATLAEGLLYGLLLYSFRTTIIRRPYRLRGRTDIIVVDPDDAILSRSSTLFAVEIKSTVDVKDDEKGINQALREACLQLVGLNAAYENRSPPVIQSYQTRLHYVHTSSGNTYCKLKL
jgi:hypothetical protein